MKDVDQKIADELDKLIKEGEELLIAKPFKKAFSSVAKKDSGFIAELLSIPKDAWGTKFERFKTMGIDLLESAVGQDSHYYEAFLRHSEDPASEAPKLNAMIGILQGVRNGYKKNFPPVSANRRSRHTMSNNKWIAPQHKSTDDFSCPWCKVCAPQRWHEVYSDDDTIVPVVPIILRPPPPAYRKTTLPLSLSVCTKCGRETLWMQDDILHPAGAQIEPPNSDLAEDAKKDYREAAAVLGNSPKAAAALLRCVAEKFCWQLGADKKKDLAFNIKDLAEKEKLPRQTKVLIETLRLTGNHASHPGFMDNKDNEGIAIALFGLCNDLVEACITHPKRHRKTSEKVRSLSSGKAKHE